MDGNTSGAGIGFTTILFFVFLALKLMGFIAWSWWWVTAPLWLPLIVVLLVIIVVIGSNILFSGR